MINLSIYFRKKVGLVKKVFGVSATCDRMLGPGLTNAIDGKATEDNPVSLLTLPVSTRGTIIMTTATATIAIAKL
jgi:hypothetical protein